MSTVNIIGSGIMGMLSAHELLKKGFKVNLFDQSAAGKESTWAGGGIISPLFPWRYDDSITQLSLLSQALYSDILDELKEHADLDPEYCHSGMLMLDCNDTDKAKTWAKQFGIYIESIDSKDIKQKFNHLNERFSQALWMPQIHQVRNPRLAQLAKQSLINQGATFYENTPITKINEKNNFIESINSNNQLFKADITLICTGAWTGDLLEHIQNDDDHDVKVQPVHGQMLQLKVDKVFFKEIVLYDERYIIPRKDELVLIGSTTEMIGFKKRTTEQVRDSLFNYACDTIPELKTAHIANHWSGLRPGSINGIPIISAHNRIKNLYINAGHYRNGLVTAPASARIIAQIICNEGTSINAEPFKMQ